MKRGRRMVFNIPEDELVRQVEAAYFSMPRKTTFHAKYGDEGLEAFRAIREFTGHRQIPRLNDEGTKMEYY